MRAVCLCLLVLCGAVAGHARPLQGRPAVAALAEARKALGGAALDAIRTIGVRARGTRVLGPLGLSSELELRVALPDGYVRIERLAVAGVSAEMVTGVRGTAPIQRASGPTGERLDAAALLPESVKATAGRAVMQAMRQEMGLLLLGLFADSFEAYPMQPAPAGVAESPDGLADVIALTGADGFAGRLFIDRRTRLPLMVSWLAPDGAAAARRFAERNSGTGEPPTSAALLADVRPVEHRLYFLDFRPVGPVRWPHRLRRAVAGTSVEEWTVDAFSVNPTFPAGTFDPQP